MVSVHAARDAWDTAIDEAKAEGREEGRAEERLSNARSLMSNGVPLEVIVKSLNLSEEERRQLL